jgi:hypothetical protein
MILSVSSLTDELTDDEARPLIQWGINQAEAAADALTRAGQSTGDPPSGDWHILLADRLDPVRRVMKRINRLVVDRHDLDAEELFEGLQHLFALAERLPSRPPLRESAVPLAEVCARQADLENQAFVQALVGLLAGPVGEGEQGC